MPGPFTVEHLAGARNPPDDAWLAVVRAPGGLTVIRTGGAGGEPWVALYGGETAHGVDVPGMLAALVAPLAGAGVPVFVASAFHADLVLVPRDRQDDAVAALTAAGHTVERR